MRDSDEVPLLGDFDFAVKNEAISRGGEERRGTGQLKLMGM